MATVILSQHSSNPLEVSSSDAQNKAYLLKLKQAQGMRCNDEHEHASSDDPLNSYNVPEMEQYHSHLAKLYPNSSISAQQSKVKIQSMATSDVDKAVLSDDELYMSGEDMVQDVHEEEEAAEGDTGDEQDAQAETDEEMTIFLKCRDEQEEIEEEIADLEAAVPQLSPDYKLIDRLGNGTFSSVYKAIDLGYHNKWDNSPWHGLHPPSSSAYYQSLPHPRETKVFVAVKRIYVTSGPERIRDEISIMEDCRGCRHVSQLITAFRQHDQVVAIMPYHRNQDFRVSVLAYDSALWHRPNIVCLAGLLPCSTNGRHKILFPLHVPSIARHSRAGYHSS